MNYIAIIGRPGVGKSHFTARLTGGWPPYKVLAYSSKGSPTHGGKGTVYGALCGGETLILGRYGPKDLHPGPDQFDRVYSWLNVKDHLLAEWATRFEAVVADGATMMQRPLLDAVRANPLCQLHVFELTASDAIIQARQLQRGTNQDPAWLRGKATAVRRITEEYGGELCPYETESDMAVLMHRVWQLTHPSQCRELEAL